MRSFVEAEGTSLAPRSALWPTTSNHVVAGKPPPPVWPQSICTHTSIHAFGGKRV